jgi:hypothetical protein
VAVEIDPMKDLCELSFCSCLDKESRKPGKRARSINASRNIMDIGYQQLSIHCWEKLKKEDYLKAVNADFFVAPFE